MARPKDYNLSDKIEKGEVDLDEPETYSVDVEESTPFVSERKFSPMLHQLRRERAT